MKKADTSVKITFASLETKLRVHHCGYLAVCNSIDTDKNKIKYSFVCPKCSSSIYIEELLQKRRKKRC